MATYIEPLDLKTIFINYFLGNQALFPLEKLSIALLQKSSPIPAKKRTEDATKKEDVEKLMNGKKADMVFTDPPYGVDYGSKNEFLNAFDKGNHIQVPITNDSMPIIDMKTFWVTCWNNMKGVMKDGVSYYICSMHSGELMMMMMTSVYESDLLLKHCLIWVKNNHVLGRMDYAPKHENIVYGWQDTHKFFGGFQTSVINLCRSDCHKNGTHTSLSGLFRVFAHT